VRAQVPPPLPHLTVVPSDLTHKSPAAGVDRKGGRHHDHVEQRELRGPDLGDEGAELDKLDSLEVFDWKHDPVPGTATRQNRLHDLRNADHNFLPLVQIVDREPDPDPTEGDEPRFRFNRPQAKGEYELRRAAHD